MKSTRQSVVFAVVLMVVGCLCSARADEDVTADDSASSVDEQFETYGAAIEQWLSDIEFACDYRSRMWRATDRETALQGDFVEATEFNAAAGVFNKAGGKLRTSRDNEAEPVLISQSGDLKTLKNLDADEVAGDQGVVLSYVPSLGPGDERGTAQFLPRARPQGLGKLQIGAYDAGLKTKRRLTPLSIDGNEVGSYLTVPEIASGMSRHVVESDTNSVVLRLKYTQGTNDVQKDVRFSLSHSLPVVSEIVTTTDNGSGRTYESIARATDFVEVAGGPIARHVRKISAMFVKGVPTNKEHPWLVSEWHSDDLGTREPTQEDFLVAINPDTRVRGIANPEEAMTDDKLDIDRVDVSKLNIRFEDDQFAGLAGTETPPGRGASWILYVNGTIAVLILGGLIYARSRRTSQGGTR